MIVFDGVGTELDNGFVLFQFAESSSKIPAVRNSCASEVSSAAATPVAEVASAVATPVAEVSSATATPVAEVASAVSTPVVEEAHTAAPTTMEAFRVAPTYSSNVGGDVQNNSIEDLLESARRNVEKLEAAANGKDSSLSYPSSFSSCAPFHGIILPTSGPLGDERSAA